MALPQERAANWFPWGLPAAQGARTLGELPGTPHSLSDSMKVGAERLVTYDLADGQHPVPL